MKFKLRLDKLKPGDIILVGYNDERSRQIQERTNSRYSHAMLLWYGSLIHASDIVITENPSRQLFEEDEAVCVLRLKQQPGNDLRIEHLIEYARSFVGTLYDMEAFIAQARGHEPIYNPNRQMCSKFVAQCFDYVCCDLVDDPDSCTPEDLYRSPCLERVDDILTEATERDEEFANSPDVTHRQFVAIKKFIHLLRQRYPEADIMSLGQLEDYLAFHPEEGDNILGMLAETEYLELWRREEELCPYLYDKKKFVEFFRENSVYQALEVKNSCERIITEKGKEMDCYCGKISRVSQLRYYDEMIRLNENIIANAEKRKTVAEEILEDNRVVKFRFNLFDGFGIV